MSEANIEPMRGRRLAGIFSENEASLAVHRECGFRVVGTRERLGRMAGRWRDVILLERRSVSVGVN